MSEILVEVAEAMEAPAEVVSDQNTVDQAPTEKVDDVEPEVQKEESPEEIKAKEEKKGQSRLNRKIDKAYRERAEAKAETAYLKQQLEELRPKPSVVEGMPRIEDFTDIETYAEAVAKVRTEKALKDYEATKRNEAETFAERRLSQSWEEKTIAAESKYPDFDEVVGELSANIPWTRAIMQAENGDDIAMYLGRNLKEAQRIASLDEFSQAREIGKLEAKLANEPKMVRQASKAPAPIKPLGGNSVISEKKLSELNQDEFDKRRLEYKKNHR